MSYQVFHIFSSGHLSVWNILLNLNVNILLLLKQTGVNHNGKFIKENIDLKNRCGCKMHGALQGQFLTYKKTQTFKCTREQTWI